MMEVKTNEEYQAAIRENQNQKIAKGLLEDKALQLLTSLDEQKSGLKEIEAEFKTQEQTILAEKKKLSEAHQVLLQELDGLQKKRLTLTANLDPSVATLYNRAVTTGKIPVAIADKGRCMGCNVQIRPQIYNEILGKTAIHRCGNCARLLIAPLPKPQNETSDDLAAK
jgi:predicted  nucleic acid-binding Zn-ribbon protein